MQLPLLCALPPIDSSNFNSSKLWSVPPQLREAAMHHLASSSQHDDHEIIPENNQSNQRTHPIYYLSLRDYILVLPYVQCQKTFAPFILSSFIIVYSGKDGLIVGTLLWPHVEITFCVYKNENY